MRVEQADGEPTGVTTGRPVNAKGSTSLAVPEEKEKDDSLVAYIIHQLHPPDPSVSGSDRRVLFSHLFHQYLTENSRRMSTCEEGTDLDRRVADVNLPETDNDEHHE